MRSWTSRFGAAFGGAASLLLACSGEPDTGPKVPVTPTASVSANPTASATSTAVADSRPPRPAFDNPGGMWMPEQMPAHAETMAKIGFSLPKDPWNPTGGAPLGAIVNLGGCTASFVSKDGLLATNHHCATRALQHATSSTKNVLKNGVVTHARSEEPWAGPTARVLVTHAVRDVTREIRKDLDKTKDDKARKLLVDKRIKEIVGACEKDHPELRCKVASYFLHSVYQLVAQVELRDIRLVYAPPDAIGDFGGEVDNWRWPRHGGDFTLFRAYVGADGSPKENAPENVPYHPKAYLPWAKEPLRNGDPVLVAGFPGRTHRWKTAAEREEVIAHDYPTWIEKNATFAELLESFAKKGDDLRTKVTPQLNGLNNNLTKMRGIVEALGKGFGAEAPQATAAPSDRKGAAPPTSDAEKRLVAFIDSDPARKTTYGDVIAKWKALVESQQPFRERDAALMEAGRMPRLFSAALAIAKMAEERAKPDDDRHPDYQERTLRSWLQETTALEKSYDREVETAVMSLVVERASRLNKEHKPKFLSKLIGKGKKEDIRKAVGDLYSKTKLGDTELRKKLFSTAKVADLKKLKDPLIDLALAARPAFQEMEDRYLAVDGSAFLIGPRYADALRALAKHENRGDEAPDANGTLRVTFGQVRGYKMKADAPEVMPFTTLAELVKKHTGQEPFDAPQTLRDAQKAGDFGPYLFADVGDVPVDFLSNVDITGGNSGSPSLNGKGEVVGLAFDTNYEGVASDWIYRGETKRCIHVDARFMAWVMDRVSGAKETLTELGITPTFAK